MIDREFMGLNGFFWFTGVVEDRNDPLKLGRVKVRLVGLHSERLQADENAGRGIQVADLPWASPLMPVTGPSVTGIGTTPSLIEGTWVVGFARDGMMYNDLVIMGTITGAPQDPAQHTGFNDTTADLSARPRRPDETTDEHYPKAAYLKEPDINRLARNEKIDQTAIQRRRDSEDKNVAIANTAITWDEKTTDYNALYPNNHVTESESGHIFEVDDTRGAERLHQYHRSGTFTEIQADGTSVHKVVGDDYQIMMKDNNIHVIGNVNITIDGNSNIYVKQNADIQVDGNIHEVVKGNISREVTGNVTENIGGNVIRTVGGTYSDHSSGNMDFKAPRIDWN